MKPRLQTNRQRIRLVRAIVSMVLMLGNVGRPARVDAALSDILGPPGSGKFGTTTAVLPNGNIVVTDPYGLGGTGAVYLYDGATLALISTLKGSLAGDQVGSSGVTVLSNGNFVIRSPNWDNGATLNVGAVTLCNGTTGCTGTVSAANSLVGTSASDFVGILAVTTLTNGNYVVRSPSWDNGANQEAGAVTLCNGTTGCTGTISATNSLIGTRAADNVGFPGVTALTNGNYVVSSVLWDNGTTQDVGAVTLCDGTTGCTGTISAANSLIGATARDGVGASGVTALTNGNYVVSSSGWNDGATPAVGAVTLCDGATGCAGMVVSAANSLIGTRAGDGVGYPGVTALTNGNYVVSSLSWSNGAIPGVGAVTLCSGTAGCTGAVSAANSLIGTSAGDGVGYPGVTALPNGNYVVSSSSWNNGLTADVGAVTFCSGPTGCAGMVVSAANSLIGPSAYDLVGYGVTALANGDYVVSSPFWDNGATVHVGAVTLCDGATGCAGMVVSAANSLVGTTAWDNVGASGVTALTDGNYVVSSPSWDNGATPDVGAVTLCDGATGCAGMVVSAANSLVGTTAINRVGSSGATALPNGHYVVSSPGWDNGSIPNAGAVTWCRGATDCTGTVISAANSVLGTVIEGAVGGFSYDATRDRLAVGKPVENLVSLFFFPSANQAPEAQCQSVTVPAAADACAVATASIDNGSSDPDGDPVTLTQSPAGPYAVGTTAVTLTASDGSLSDTCTATVTVEDRQAPTITCPANQTVTTPFRNGVVVNYPSPQSFDNCSTLMTSCAPPSGSTFLSGNTTVTCTATDGTGLQQSCSFNVQVIVNDQAPELRIDDVSLAEGNGGATRFTFTVTLSKPSRSLVTVQHATSDGTAVGNRDYERTGGVVVFRPGETSNTVMVNVLGEPLPEVDETFTVNLFNASSASIGKTQGLGTILNDDGPKLLISDATSATRGREGNNGITAFTFAVTMSQPSPAPVTVQYATADGTALAGSDYVATNGTLTFQRGETRKTVTINVVGDTVPELDETFTVNLSNASYAVIAKGQGTGTIVNDDRTFVVISDVSRAEGSSNGQGNVFTFTVTLSQTSNTVVTVQYATADGTAILGQDYIPTGGTVVFGPRETRKTITVNVVDDRVREPNEQFFVNLSNANGTTIVDGQGIGTILNDDGPTLEITDVSRAEGNGGRNTYTFTVTLNGASSSPITVAYATADGTATAGSDYNATSGTLTFLPRQTSQTITVDVLGDTARESDETFAVHLSTATNATIFDGEGIGTIVNDD